MLSEPVQVGSVRLRNRLVFPAHLTGAATDGLPTPQHAAYYGARAAGGAGLVITEELSVAADDHPYEKMIDGSDHAVLPGLRAIAEAVHAPGSAVFAQLNHNGAQSSGLYSREPLRAPSPVPDPMFREMPAELSVAEIGRLGEAYAQVAARCAQAGFDGVELQCSQASLLRQFLSPLTNLRTDRYGGSAENRVRAVAEVATAVRAALGPRRVLGVRLCGDEGLPGGVRIAEAVATARLLAPLIDYVNTTVGIATATLHLVEPPMPVPAGYALGTAAAIRAAVPVPVIGVGRFTEFAQAEAALASGACDLVGVARGQIADPGFGSGPVRRCIACNQECAGRVGLGRPLGCLVQPRTGREAVPVPPPRRRRRVLVVGAGPAGLAAAATAAARGHDVVLHERGPRAGGRLAVAAAAPTRASLGDLTADLLRECHASGVRVRTGSTVSPALVARASPDVVVLATGARPARPAWGRDLPRIADVAEVLAGVVVPTGSVLVYDELGAHDATSAAEVLAARGCAVEIVTPALVVGQDLGLTLDAELFARRAHAAGIVLTPERLVVAARDGGVDLLHHLTGAVERRRVDWVVTAVAPEPDDALWAALRDGAVPVRRVGDCLAPRRADAAVREGTAAGEEL